MTPLIDNVASSDSAQVVPIYNGLQELFGFSSFRKLQEPAVAAAIEGRNLLVVMPTGSGKSLCFQLPALMSEGVTVVVSPLIALIRDQVDALNRSDAREALGVDSLTSMQSPDQQRSVLGRLRRGQLRMLYVSPERFRSGAFLDALKGSNIVRLVVDEAHCISEWGHDFRPDYLALRSVLQELGSPPVTAVTATATRRVQKSIIDNLGLENPVVLVGGFDRSNLHWAVHRCASDQERRNKLVRALPRLAAAPGSGLIYVPTRKLCEEIGEIASAALPPDKRAGIYHAGLHAADRDEAQARWLSGEWHLLIATSAFGMGINKSDVRYVLHYGYPESLEAYYQEAGRAGRDGRRSRCVVLSCFTDRKTRLWLIEKDALALRDVEALYRLLQAGAGSDPHAASKSTLLRTLDFSPTKLRLALARLERASLISSFSENSEEIRWEAGAQEWTPRLQRELESSLRAQMSDRLGRLAEMIDYCRSSSCRRRAILDYFGDTAPLAGGGPCCDVCDSPGKAAKSPAPLNEAPAPMPRRIDPASIYDIIQAIDATRPALGKKRLSLLLRGSASTNSPDASSPLFGVLKAASKTQVDGFLEELVGLGLLRRGGEDEYFVYAVTADGRSAWKNRSPLPTAVPGARLAARPGPPDGQLTREAAEEAALFERLRIWRRQQAQQQSVPPYCVLPDKTLHAIAVIKPSTSEQLLEIPGIGQARLAQYGDELIALLAG